MLNFCTLSSLNNLRICFNYSRREKKNSGGNLRHQRNYPFYHTPLEFSSNVFNQYCADSRFPFVSFVGKLIMLWLNLNNNLKIEHFLCTKLMDVESEFDLPFRTMCQPITVYAALFSPAPVAVSLLCQLLCK